MRVYPGAASNERQITRGTKMPITRIIIVLLFGIGLYPVSFMLLGETFGEILFYRGVVHGLLVFGLQVIVGVFLLKGDKGGNRMREPALRRVLSLALASLALSFNLTFLIVFPVTFDRSVTTYLLEQLAHKGPLSVEQMQSLLINDYVVRDKAVLRRMREQELSGNVEVRDGSYALTTQGEEFISISRGIRRLFHIAPHDGGQVAPADPVGE